MTRRGPGRPRDPQTDVAILAAAMELFVERSIDAMSIEQVAKRASVAKLTAYRRWTSKEQLVADAIERFVEDREWPSNAAIETGTPAEIVASTLDASTEVAASPEYRALVARIFGSSVSNPSLMATYWKHYLLPRRKATAVLLANAKHAGTVAADADAEVLIDMMAGAVVYRVLQPDPPDVTEMRRYLTELYRLAGFPP